MASPEINHAWRAQLALYTSFKRFFWGMLERGFYLAPSPFEALFLSSAHTEADIDQTVAAASDVLAAVFSGEGGS